MQARKWCSYLFIPYPYLALPTSLPLLVTTSYKVILLFWDLSSFETPKIYCPNFPKHCFSWTLHFLIFYIFTFPQFYFFQFPLQNLLLLMDYLEMCYLISLCLESLNLLCYPFLVQPMLFRKHIPYDFNIKKVIELSFMIQHMGHLGE